MDGRALGQEQCENMKKIVSKYGVNIVCNEEDLVEKPNFVMPASESCENMKEATSKYGVKIVCEE